MKDITAARKLAHMSQTKLGEIVEKSTTTISRYEHGIATPSADTLRLMLGALANELQDLKKTIVIIKKYGEEDRIYKGKSILAITDEGYIAVEGNPINLAVLYIMLGAQLNKTMSKSGEPAGEE